MQCWCRDGDSNSGLPVESRRVLATRRSRRIGSPTRIRTWIDRLTIGRPAVGRSGNGGAPRTRAELNLLAREICGPCAYPDWVALGARPCSACNGAMARWVRPPRRHGAWGRFRAHLSAASARRFHQISFPGEFRIGAADGNRTHVCALATHGSAIELRTLVHRAGLEPAKHIGTRFTVRPRCRLSICASRGAGDLAIARTGVGGRLTVRTPHLAVPTRFQDGVPATPAEPSRVMLNACQEHGRLGAI